MARRTRRNRSLLLALVLWVCGVASLLVADRTYRLSGLELTSSLEIGAGSVIPSGAPIELGDRVVAIDGHRVTRLSDVSLLLGFTGDATSNVRILRGGGGPSTQVEGPVSVERDRVSLSGMLLLALTLGAVFGVSLARREARDGLRREAPRSEGPLVAASGVAVAMLVAAAGDPELSPTLVLAGFGWAIVSRAVAVHSHLRRAEVDLSPSAHAAIHLPVVLTALVLGGAAAQLAGMAPARSLLEDIPLLVLSMAGLAGAYQLVDAAIAVRRPEVGRAIRLGALIGAAGVVLGGVRVWVSSEEGSGAVVAPAALVVAVAWFGDLWTAYRGESVSSRRRTGEGTLDVLGVLNAIAAGTGMRPAIGAGIAGRWVTIEAQDPSGTGERVIRARPASSVMSDFLGMLHAEGGLYPRPVMSADEADHNPFATLGGRVPVAAAVPIPATGGATPTFALVLVDDEGPAEVDVNRVTSVVEDIDGASLRDGVTALAAAALLEELRRVERRGALSTGPIAGAPVEGRPVRDVAAGGVATEGRDRPVDERAGRSDGQASARAEVRATAPAAGPTSAVSLGWREAARACERLWPVDDEEMLTRREREALSPWVRAPGAIAVVGEPGTGKEHVARVIHRMRGLAERPLVVVDAAVVPPAEVELRLCGDPASPASSGVAEWSDATIVVKSLSVVPPEVREAVFGALRPALSRTIFIERIAGGDGAILPGILGPTGLVPSGGVLSLTPLRDRPDDVVRCATAWLLREAMQYDRLATGFDEEAEELLMNHEYPANFHDLRLLVRSALLHAQGSVVTAADLRSVLPGGVELEEPTSEAERKRIAEAMDRAAGNKSEAARLLGMSRGKLLRRLRRMRGSGGA